MGKVLVTKLFKGKYSKELKKKVFNNCVFPVPRVIIWIPDLGDKKKTIKRIEITQNVVERSMLGIKLKDKINIRR